MNNNENKGSAPREASPPYIDPSLTTPTTPPTAPSSPQPNQPPANTGQIPPVYPPQQPVYPSGQPYNQSGQVPFPSSGQNQPPMYGQPNNPQYRPPNYGQPAQNYPPPQGGQAPQPNYQPYGQPAQQPNYPQQGQPYYPQQGQHPNYPPPTYPAPNYQQQPPTYQQQPPTYPVQPRHPAQNPYQQRPVKPADTRSFEEKYGGKITTILGISFMLLAVIFGLYYTYTILESNLIKSIIAYGVGLVFIIIGELFNRKSKSSFFSLGLCAGGIAMLFATTAISYFELNVFNEIPALIIIAVLFLISMFLALRYNSELIGIFAVVGGFSPIIAVGPKSSMLVPVVIYLAIVNLLVLALAQKKNWVKLKFSGFILHAICAVFLVDIVGSSSITASAVPLPSVSSKITVAAVLCYVFVVFLLYLTVALWAPLKQNRKLSASELVLTSLNILLSYIFLFSTMDNYALPLDGMWLVSTIFSVLLFALYLVWKKNIPEDKSAANLFLTAATLFAFLLILFLESWVGTLDQLLVTAVAGVTIIITAIFAKDKKLQIAGGAFTLIGTFGFHLAFWNDALTPPSSSSNYPFDTRTHILRFMVLTIVLAILFIFTALQSRKENRSILGSKGSALEECVKSLFFFNLWLFAAALIYRIPYPIPKLMGTFWQHYIFCFASLLFVFFLTRRWVFATAGVRILALIPATTAAVLLPFYLNLTQVTHYYYKNLGIKYSVVGALLIINLFAVYCLCSLVSLYLNPRKNKANVIPLVAFLSSLALVTMVVSENLLAYDSFIPSIMMLVWALAMIFYGFSKKINNIRFIGLILSMIAVFRIFVLDITYIYGWQRAASFAVVGIIFFAISFVYQSFNAKLRAEKGSKPVLAQVSVGAPPTFVASTPTAHEKDPEKEFATEKEISELEPDKERWEETRAENISEIGDKNPSALGEPSKKDLAGKIAAEEAALLENISVTEREIMPIAEVEEKAIPKKDSKQTLPDDSEQN